LGLGVLISDFWFAGPVRLAGRPCLPWHLFIGVFIHAHLVIVFFRSHANPKIFKQHRFRFILVPLLLFWG
jgi:hypothetical protein